MSIIGLVTLVNQGIAYALQLIQERYEDNANPEGDLPFHNVKHTKGVIRRTALLLSAMRVDERTIQLGRLAAAFHDTVQNWEPNPGPDGKVMRKRFAGRNEEASAAEAIAWMRQYLSTFTREDKVLVTKAIMATVPGWDPEAKTVYQPNLKADSHPVVRAVALADLGTGGIDGREFAKEGDPLFREENLDIAAAIRAAKTQADVPSSRQETYKARMLAWSKSQAGFVRGRKQRLELELGNLDAVLKDCFRSILFHHFGEAAQAADELVAQRENLPFWEVARAMGYSVPTE